MNSGNSSVPLSRLSPWNYLLFIIAAALSFQIISVRYQKGTEYPFATFEKLVHFKAETPFQDRLLVTVMATVTEKVLNHFNIPLNYRKFFFCADVISLLLTWFFFSLLLKKFLNLSHEIISIVALSIYLPVCFIFVFTSSNLLYPYDIPQILFFTIGLYMIITKKMSLFIPLFILCTFNRETSAFLIPMVLFAGKKNIFRENRLILYIILLFVIWISIKVFLHAVIPNPGQVFYYKLDFNFNYIKTHDLIRWIQLLCGTLLILIIPILIFLKRLKKYSFVNILFVLLLFYIAMLVIGKIFEYRIFSENIPLIIFTNVVLCFDLFAPGKIKDELKHIPLHD